MSGWGRLMGPETYGRERLEGYQLSVCLISTWREGQVNEGRGRLAGWEALESPLSHPTRV